MSQVFHFKPDRLPPVRERGLVRWLRMHVFSSPISIAMMVLLLWVLMLAIPAFWDWAVTSSNLTADSALACRESSGACWAMIRHQYRLILFGIYPYTEQWRPLLASILMVIMVVASAIPALWARVRVLILAWVAALFLIAWLMWGGFWGLSYVSTDQWGGLPLTLILSISGIVFAFPVGVLLALGRRSKMPIIKSISVIYIEIIRGVPLISLLIMASVMLPLFLPHDLTIPKLLRIILAIVMFAAAYVAETVRGGLQALDRGQYEGADSLGLSYWQSMRLVILPQALTAIISPMFSIFISLFKDTSLVAIISLFDLAQLATTASSTGKWTGTSTEAYLFIGAIYFIFCYAMSKYAQHLETRFRKGERK